MPIDVPDCAADFDEIPPDRWDEHPHTLADLLPWITRGFGGGRDVASGGGLPVLQGSDVVLLLIDGLGERQLDAHRHIAPTLAGLQHSVLRSGFPSTTATSITSLMSGAPAAVHGIIGYSFRPDIQMWIEGPSRVLNVLRWSLGTGVGHSALEVYPPTSVAPAAGAALAAMAASGVRIFTVMPGDFRSTGFTQVAFGGVGRYLNARTPSEIRAGVVTALTREVARSQWPRFVYAYLSDLDTAGHVHGPGSDQWIAALRVVDGLVADLLTELPSDVTLIVTGDHGMLGVGELIDLDGADDRADGLAAGVDAVAGEARVRQVYAVAGAAADVVDSWRGLLATSARVATREQVLDEKWYGSGSIAPARIGDVVAVARGSTVLARTASEVVESRMLGHHGGWTADELLVPLLFARSQ
ncbi:MAG: alkaline phosphatase family protein [Gordonia sp. (in: high G+C Gram-positive bacteria)]